MSARAPLHKFAAALRAHPAIRSKLAIGHVAQTLGLSARAAGAPGDDAAILPRGGGFDLLAGEGFIPAFVREDPWFAGWCGVMVNLSDIAAMGGRAVALIDHLWAPNAQEARPILAGLKDASDAYGAPLVGGHTNYAAHELGLSVSVFGRAEALISSFAAKPGDAIICAFDPRGVYRNFDNFFAAAGAPAARLRGDLELLPRLAEDKLALAGKDISQGGIAGTALMLAECSNVGVELDLDRIEPPRGATLQRWMHTFPSYGFLLCAAPENAAAICGRFAARDIAVAVIGRVIEGAEVRFTAEGASTTFWDHAGEPYLGFKCEELQHA